MLNLYELDEDGNKIKQPITRKFKGTKNYVDTYIYKIKTIGLHRAMWAWFNGEVPEGYVVDHINNRHGMLEDYQMFNLQILTPAENLEKEAGISTKQIACKLTRPLSFYEDKLNKYLAAYEEAKANHDSELAHKLRGNIANTKARIRYYLAHKEEAERLQAEEAAKSTTKKEYRGKAAKIKEYKAAIKSARKYYKEALEAYGPDDINVLKLKHEWKFAVYALNQYLFEQKLKQINFSSEDN